MQQAWEDIKISTPFYSEDVSEDSWTNMRRWKENNETCFGIDVTKVWTKPGSALAPVPSPR